MKIINEKIAQELAKKFFSQINDKKHGSFLLEHSILAGNVAVSIGKHYGLDINTLKIAGYLHDIGYIVNEEEHAKHSLELLKDYEINETLKDCILNHSSSAKPTTDEGLVFQVADKLYLLDSSMIEFTLNENDIFESINYLKKTTAKGLEIFENYVKNK